MKADNLPEYGKHFGPISFWNIFKLKERIICSENSKRGLFSENVILYFRDENMCHLKVTLGLGDCIKNGEAHMKEEKKKKSK